MQIALSQRDYRFSVQHPTSVFFSFLSLSSCPSCASQRPVHVKIDESPAQVYRCSFQANLLSRLSTGLPRIMDVRDSTSESLCSRRLETFRRPAVERALLLFLPLNTSSSSSSSLVRDRKAAFVYIYIYTRSRFRRIFCPLLRSRKERLLCSIVSVCGNRVVVKEPAASNGLLPCRLSTGLNYSAGRGIRSLVSWPREGDGGGGCSWSERGVLVLMHGN